MGVSTVVGNHSVLGQYPMKDPKKGGRLHYKWPADHLASTTGRPVQERKAQVRKIHTDTLCMEKKPRYSGKYGGAFDRFKERSLSRSENDDNRLVHRLASN